MGRRALLGAGKWRRAWRLCVLRWIRRALVRWVRRREGRGGWLRVQLARAFQSRKHFSDPTEGQAKAIVGVLTSGGRGRERWLLENVGQRVLNEAEVAVSDEHHVERVQKRLAVDRIRGGGNIFQRHLPGVFG